MAQPDVKRGMDTQEDGNYYVRNLWQRISDLLCQKILVLSSQLSSEVNTLKKVRQIDHLVSKKDVYNLEVEGLKCYSVGKSGIIIHNCFDRDKYFFMSRPSPIYAKTEKEKTPIQDFRIRLARQKKEAGLQYEEFAD